MVTRCVHYHGTLRTYPGNQLSWFVNESEQAVFELNVHVGYPKAATVSLQEHVFPRFPGYVGKSYDDDRRAARFEGANSRLLAEYSKGELCTQTVQGWIRGLGVSNQEVVLYSEERLSQ